MATQSAVKRKKREQSEYFFDYSLLFIVLFLMGFGLVMIYSASSYEAFQKYKDAGHYLKIQLLAICIGLGMMIFVEHIPEKVLRKLAIPGYIVSAALIPVVKTPLGKESHGAYRWIKIPGTSLTFQPAEVAKIGIILLLAVVIAKLGKNIKTIQGAALMLGLPMPLVLEIYLITKNLSSAVIILGIAIVMYFVASPDYKKFVIVGLLGVAGIAVFIYMIVTGEATTGTFRSDRIVAWLNPEASSQVTGYQTLQALYAIGSGGVWGKGLGQSMQKLNFLPESQNDMIFSIICEELGLFGAVAIILMFILLLWRMMVIANNAPDLFSAMLVVGVMSHIAIQAILNVAVVTNTIPNTGVSLPFISYGGTSVMFLLIEIGLVLNVARRIQLKQL